MSASWSGGSTRAWRRVRLYVLVRDGWRCQLPHDDDRPGQLCGAFASEVDHVIPKSEGGTDTPDNLRGACSRHNRSRGAALLRRQRARRRQPERTWTW